MLTEGQVCVFPARRLETLPGKVSTFYQRTWRRRERQQRQGEKSKREESNKKLNKSGLKRAKEKDGTEERVH